MKGSVDLGIDSSHGVSVAPTKLNSPLSPLNHKYDYPHYFVQLYCMIMSNVYVKSHFKANVAGH